MVGSSHVMLPQGLQEHLGSEAARGVESFQTCRQKIAKMVNSNTFEYAAGMVILANMIVIGIEAQESLNLDQLEFAEYTWPWFAERLFLLIYSALDLSLFGFPLSGLQSQVVTAKRYFIGHAERELCHLLSGLSG